MGTRNLKGSITNLEEMTTDICSDMEEAAIMEAEADVRVLDQEIIGIMIDKISTIELTKTQEAMIEIRVENRAGIAKGQRMGLGIDITQVIVAKGLNSRVREKLTDMAGTTTIIVPREVVVHNIRAEDLGGDVGVDTSKGYVRGVMP